MTLNSESVPKLSARTRIQRDKATGKPVLLAQETVILLNDTMNAVLSYCDGKRTVGNIATELAAQYCAPPSAIENDVLKCLEKLSTLNLVTDER